MQPLLIPASIGELIDKITILTIKVNRLKGPKQQQAQHELTLLQTVLDDSRLSIKPELQDQLQAVNTNLWEIEDAIRELERQQSFGTDFIALARSVYRNNDQRAAIKQAINQHHGSDIVEVKSYAAYD